MDAFLGILRVTLTEGFIYAVLALGVYITYSILDFPDLSVDGTVPLGAVVTGVLILHGVNPWLCCLISFACGALAGSVTGLLNVKLKIRPLLCGILVMTSLISINLLIVKTGTRVEGPNGLTDGVTVANFFTDPTIFSTAPTTLIPKSVQIAGSAFQLRTIVLVLIIALIVKYLLDWYLTTRSGMLLRAAGSNAQYVTMLARNPGVSRIIGLALGNGLAALAGSVIAQQKGSADLQMGTGMVVLGLASVIVGLSIFRKVRFLRPTSKVVLGALVYKACLTIAMTLGLPTELLNFLMAALLTVALVATHALNRKKGGEAL